jgi:hypothetical protein
MKSLGFIILRHVNNNLTNNYWMSCYDSIRTFYPDNKIVIIDDNSNKEFLTEKELHNAIVINSHFPKRGELLPYIYYATNNWFDVGVILHDSVFINRPIDFMTDTYKFLWEFNPCWDHPTRGINAMIPLRNGKALTNFEKKTNLWKGCFGSMCSISHLFLRMVYYKHSIQNLIPVITSRDHRCDFERIIAIILQLNAPKKTILGDIMTYCKWGITYDQKDNYKHLPIVKVWTGR